MYVNGAKHHSHATQSEYEPSSRDAIQDFLESRGLIFDVKARDQKERYDDFDFYCHNHLGEMLRFEVESREYDLSTLTAGWFPKFRANTVHFPLRKLVSRADFFVSYCTADHNRSDECVFIAEAFDVLTSNQQLVKCNNKNYKGNDLMFNVPITKGVRFARRDGQWVAFTAAKIDRWCRRDGSGSFIFRLRKDDWRNYSVVKSSLAKAYATCVVGV